ncbi:GPP34 family phosphoprotein [Amycolatopsis sp. EV170708-02-1]|uniref:GOLPH3/VPS74 family protein n=1 Tax=Amycolatopsis sp. EV170708-02-1 TaxID=2919322 RepID=UPI001F0C83A5|nr:GPP34 family phosphoprotein [Amycolatopsis sp. EV170708-02-1]UMO99304.1 GPP34 family phosphoprotein [Amycolatopsis sp. EV170708-02-1]
MTQSLPQRMYLLGYDTEKSRLDPASAVVRGSLLRAAAVAELILAGLLIDRDGKAERTAAAGLAPGDPFLAKVLEDAPGAKPRRWLTVVDRDWHKAEDVVRDQLATAGTITVGRHRALGIFPVRDITLADPPQADALRERVRDVVLSGRDPAAVPIEDAVLAVLSAEGDVHTVFSAKENRAHRSAIKALAARFDTTLPGLRKAVQYSVAARRSVSG